MSNKEEIKEVVRVRNDFLDHNNNLKGTTADKKMIFIFVNGTCKFKAFPLSIISLNKYRKRYKGCNFGIYSRIWDVPHSSMSKKYQY